MPTNREVTALDGKKERRSPVEGVPVLGMGFRPFFLGAGVWAAAAMALWIATVEGHDFLPSTFGFVRWHTHEMLFGFIAAAVAGFLLTAVPNWTGRLPVRGWPLLVLFGLWLAGRLAVAFSERIGVELTAAVDLAFLSALFVTLTREIVVARRWRNLVMPAIVGVLLAANALVHVESVGIGETADLGVRLGIASVAFLIALVGGRIVPSFTRNWLRKRGESRLPASFGWPDRLALVAVGFAGVSFAAAPGSVVSGALALLAAAANLVRLARWRGHRTLPEPLVWVLHLGYGWLVAGFGLLGAAAFTPALPETAALHALSAGATGTMILGVMTRATLGHSGRALHAGIGTAAVYVLVSAAALTRILSGLLEAEGGMLVAAALMWISAFALFIAIYAPMLIGPRRRPY